MRLPASFYPWLNLAESGVKKKEPTITFSFELTLSPLNRIEAANAILHSNPYRNGMKSLPYQTVKCHIPGMVLISDIQFYLLAHLLLSFPEPFEHVG